MNCTSEVHKVPGLKPRRPKGLRRPTKAIAGLGTIELVRDERGHSWQMTRSLVSTRATLFDGLFGKNEDPAQDVELMSIIAKRERSIRENAIHARYFQFVDAKHREPQFEEIVANIDEWVAPYRIDRWVDGLVFSFDCSDAPQQQLVGARQVRVAVDPDWSIYDVRYYTADVSDELQLEAYRQRVLPDCFVVDSIADQFIGTLHVTPTVELASLLAQSIDQTGSLMRSSCGSSKAFLRCAYSLLCRIRDSRFSASE
jgi:hypothetical protein